MSLGGSGLCVLKLTLQKHAHVDVLKVLPALLARSHTAMIIQLWTRCVCVCVCVCFLIRVRRY